MRFDEKCVHCGTPMVLEIKEEPGSAYTKGAEKLILRNKRRALCGKCQRWTPDIEIVDPLKIEGECEKCQQPLVIEIDGLATSIQKRLSAFLELNTPTVTCGHCGNTVPFKRK